MVKPTAVPDMDEEQMAAHLTETGRYRILRKLDPRPIATMTRSEFPLKAVILDTETTGPDHRKDGIIEIGAIAFTFNEQGTSAMSRASTAASSSRQFQSPPRLPG